ncbi:MAG: outer membrane beta-barrel protein, partial [Phenylobacterium sp.]
MRLLKASLCAAAVSLGFGGAALADPLGMPAMSSTLSANPNPASFDAGPLGKVFVTGVASGLLNGQSNAVDPPDHAWFGDLSNAQVFIQKTDGPLQFFIQAGAYSLPSLGVPYAHVVDARNAANETFSYLPQAYVKLQPTSEFSIEAGKLPTLVG